MPPAKILVVGTTTDYVAYLDAQRPGSLVFVTDGAERARGRDLPPHDEILADLSDSEATLLAVTQHLSKAALVLSGIACFDCESLPLAAVLARAFGLRYPSPAAIFACRDKARAKRLWQASGVACAAGDVAQSPDDARRIFSTLGGPVVLKPRTGSGSAFIASATTSAACVAALQDIQAWLAQADDRLYAFPGSADDDPFDPLRSLLIEARVDGPEYSADFILDGDRVMLLRTSRKVVAASGATFGETVAYITPATFEAIDPDRLATQLRNAAHALGLRHALCTADFIVAGTQAILLELAPRPGGDCLPRLVRNALGRDTLIDALTVAEGHRLVAPATPDRPPLVGLMLRAATPGVIEQIDDQALRADSRTIDCVLSRGAGDRLSFDSPADRVVGELVFAPRASETIEQACRELRSKLVLQMTTS